MLQYMYDVFELLSAEGFQSKKVGADHMWKVLLLGRDHGLRTPNEGTNLRYLKKWADVADKICCRHT